MMTPIVVQLDDDNCDGATTALDLPDIVVTTFENGAWFESGTMHALTVRDGRLVEKWSFPEVSGGRGQLAGGNFHPSTGGEVIACTPDGHAVAVSSTGTELWHTSANVNCFTPALADLDQDGHVEVIVEGAILSGATGAILHRLPMEGSFVVSDVDSDGKLDVVAGAQIFAHDRTTIADARDALAEVTTSAEPAMPVVVDLDVDGRPEIAVVIPGANRLALWRHSATSPEHYEILRAPFTAVVDGAPGPGPGYGMGSITAGDFDGDRVPDLAYVGLYGYVVLSGAKLMDRTRPSTLDEAGVLLWKVPTHEDNGSTGSALFDFDGDGRVEVLYNATDRLHIMSGETGVSLGSICNTSGTLFEYPVVADVDGDGEANVIIVANSYGHDSGAPLYQCDGTWQSGLRVLGSSNHSWVRAPRVWNQHSYHVTNVDEDGNIPTIEQANWTVDGLNNFRQNRQPGADYGAPDAALQLHCQTDTTAVLTVQNLGEALLPAGLDIVVSDASGARTAIVRTTRALLPAETQRFDDIPIGTWRGGSARPSARIAGASGWRRDCRFANDVATLECLE